MKQHWIAPAKLNLFLHILDQRIDSYHNLETIFQFLDYGDDLYFEVRDDDQVNIRTPILGVPNEQNLIYKAAQVLKANTEITDRPLGVDIDITKRLPMGGGLGGGSSNAATTLIALCSLWDLEFNKEQLLTLGIQLGADVPVFIAGDSCFAEGIGERMTPCELPERWFLVLIPKIQVNTAKIFSDPALTRNSKSIRIRAPLNWDQLSELRNDCEAVVRNHYSEVNDALEWLSQYGLARMTGTGSCVFSPFKSEAEARKIANLVPDGFNYFVAKSTGQSIGIGATTK